MITYCNIQVNEKHGHGRKYIYMYNGLMMQRLHADNYKSTDIIINMFPFLSFSVYLQNFAGHKGI